MLISKCKFALWMFALLRQLDSLWVSQLHPIASTMSGVPTAYLALDQSFFAGKVDAELKMFDIRFTQRFNAILKGTFHPIGITENTKMSEADYSDPIQRQAIESFETGAGSIAAFVASAVMAGGAARLVFMSAPHFTPVFIPGKEIALLIIKPQ